MNKNTRELHSPSLHNQGANALWNATISFLRRNRISDKSILACARGRRSRWNSRKEVRQYGKLVRAYEDMGMVMSSWFLLPSYLDRHGHPLPLNIVRGPKSVSSLVRSSRVNGCARDRTNAMFPQCPHRH